jgi:predicted component of type VI protein secretion system
MTDRPRFALRFISGKYQGGEFPVRLNREIIIGRSSDLDMVLVEDMVSRRHAKISSSENEVFIQDLGSTNGTFVNGEKIAGRARLSEGDRILLGTSIIRPKHGANWKCNRPSVSKPKAARCRGLLKKFRCPTCYNCFQPAENPACYQ